MAYRPILSVLAAILFIAISCGNNTDSNLIDIDHAIAWEMINSENPPLIIDVRSQEEFNGELGHLEGARLIPHYLVVDSLEIFQSFDNHDILLVCRSGRRSKIAGNDLSNSGIENIYNLVGGMKSWNLNFKNQ
jgi:rhodanese-related sulfurtransferase